VVAGLLYALVGTLCVLLFATFVICCLIRARASDGRPRQAASPAAAADGLHIMNGIRCVTDTVTNTTSNTSSDTGNVSPKQ
jgi:hypothetical protein